MPKSYPLVTSIVLCYKKFDHLYDAINSILNQDYPRIELIISDDASGNFPEENVRNYIQKNKKNNIVNTKIIINRQNLGTVRNLNGALKAGSGEYFVGLPGDDVFYDNTVMRRVVERFVETGNEILCCRRLRCSEEGLLPLRLMPNNAYLPIIKMINSPKKQYRAFALGRYYEMASGSTTYFSRKHFERWGYFDESYILWEDGPFFAQYTRSGNIIPTAYDIIAIRYREGGISNSKPNPLMLKDYSRFINVECYQHKDKFNKLDRRYLSFLFERSTKFKGYSKSKQIWILIKYFDVVIHKLGYKYFGLFISFYESNIRSFNEVKGEKNGLQ
ncbi:GT2 family glycosyltransferase [Bacillus oleivorans]|uniref:GT2 family glycosyltransferase n=1 Tax=Bacillus oleivorans TaxID=1448271 RepID=A0A285CJB7_9BACI|nr:glycosyltransferase family 2 protein [Bacillus oleivorans]SNX67083.1 GT2 family glycosyltransferase [Bacillus oleivorans]